MSEKNSLESLLGDMIRLENNSVTLLSKLMEVQTAKDESITIELTNRDGSTSSYTVQSMSYLKSQIERISKTLDNITGLNSKSVAIKDSQGNTRMIFAAQMATEPAPIEAVSKPLFFFKKNNKIVDKLLNPIPYVKFDLTGKVDQTIQRVAIRKVILKLDTVDNINYFNSNFNGTNVAYEDLLSNLEIQGISYEEYDEIVDLPPRLAKYSGSFNVVKTRKGEVTDVIGATSVRKSKIFYQLNTLLYKDLENNKSDVILKKDNIMIVNSDIKDTRYVIDSVDPSTNEISLILKEGNRAVTPGVGKLLIDPGVINTTFLEVGVNIDEYVVVFFKPLNPTQNVVNQDWGIGIGLYSSELVDFDDQKNNTQLKSFYSTFIKDIGKAAEAVTKDNIIPLSDAIKPDKPVLNAFDFQVMQINTHLQDNQSIDELKKKFAQKNTVNKDIERIDFALEGVKLKLSTENFKNQNEKDNLKKTRDDLIASRSTKVSEYNSLISDIVARTRTINDFKPKYRVRGHVSLPGSKYTDPVNLVGQQDVCQVIYEYRFLRKDKTSPVSESQEITGPDGEKKKATFSRWERIESKRRERTIAEPTATDQLASTVANASLSAIKKPEWVEENENDPDSISINQIETPISPDESVEIRVRFVSEAGFPFMQSDWSDSIIMEFPEELKDQVQFISSEANDEAVRAKFLQELNALFLPQHLATQQSVGDLFFAHTGEHVAGPYKTPENKPIHINQTVTELKTEIDALKAVISGDKGQIKISITDSLGNVLQDVSKNSQVNLFAGYYKDEIATATIQKGEIVTKLFYIEISNIAAADLQLLSYLPGLPEEKMPDSTYTGYTYNKSEYDTYRKYWEVPQSLRALVDNSELAAHHQDETNPFLELPAFQSMQVKGQSMYVRKRDITLNTELLKKDSTPANNVFLPISSGGTPSPFVWDETVTVTTPNGNGNLTDFCVHIEHPELVATSDFMTDFANMYDVATKLPVATLDPSDFVRYPHFIHSRYFNLQSTDVDGLTQLEYIPYTKVTSGATVNNFPKKIGFSPNDKYLIGKNTCGCYMFLGADVEDSLYVGSNIYNVGKIIKQGSANAIRIPVIFQYRMTDFYGAGTTGVGVIGGYGSSVANNLTYAKRMGFDILIKDQELFSFDIRIDAQYKAKSVADLKAI